MKFDFDKYELYQKSVQSPDSDVWLLKKIYRELKKKPAKILREDFCGTFALACEWVKQGQKCEAHGVDLDPEPLKYGQDHYLPKLKVPQRKRLHLKKGNVLTTNTKAADVSVALNFSYFIFHERELMKKYFKKVYRGLKRDGIFVVDIFGGSACQDECQDRFSYGGFNYYWHQQGYDPVTNKAQFQIHFKVKGKGKTEKVFTYDWRMWTIPEIRELMAEVGFRRTHIYWEGTNRKGFGNGVFTRVAEGEPCEAWIAYIVAEK